MPTLHKLENACIGLIIGETATYLDGIRDLKQVPARTCKGTYSFVLARALALGAAAPEKAVSGWFEARELTRQSPLPLSKRALYAPWYVLLGLETGAWRAELPEAEVPSSILDAVQDLFLKGEIDGRQWRFLSSELPGIGEIATLMRGPRENRVKVLEEAVHYLRSAPKDSSDLPMSFVLGYLASQIAPGTMDHLQLLSPHVQSFPGVLMWYGLCAGLHRRSTVASYAGGLGRRAIREVLRREFLLDRPTCDISLSELRMLSLKGSFDFRTSSNSQIEIGIAPCITPALRWPPRSDSMMFDTAPLQVNLTATVEALRFDLEDVTERLKTITSRLPGGSAPPASKRTSRDRRPGRR